MDERGDYDGRVYKNDQSVTCNESVLHVLYVFVLYFVLSKDTGTPMVGAASTAVHPLLKYISARFTLEALTTTHN